MPDTLLRILEKLIDLAKGSLCVASGILLALYTFKVNAFKLYALLSSSNAYPAVIFIVFIVSGVFFLRDVLAQGGKRFYKLNLEQKSRKAALDKLRYYLTHQQKQALHKLVTSSSFSEYFVYNSHIEELDKYNLISSSDVTLEAEGYRMGGDRFRCTIQPWVFKYLQKHPELLEIK